jgi:O-antigen ligase
LVGLTAGETGMRPGTIMAILGSLLWIVILSPTLLESDAYRYAALLLSLIATYYFYLYHSRIRIHWIGWLCIAWGVYAAARFLLLYFQAPVHHKGASEWLYIFPIFFPVLGIALAAYRPYVARIIAAYFVIVLVFLLATTNYGHILAGEPVTPLIQKNRIHGAVACGLILISAFFWMMHYTLRRHEAPRLAQLALSTAPVIIVLCLLNIYGSKSKGVWLAIVLCLPLMLILAQRYMRHPAVQLIGLAIVALFVGGIALFWGNLVETAGPTLSAVTGVVRDISTSSDISTLFAQSINSDQTPLSMNERLQLWSNAWEVFSAAPIFGQGNLWLESWKHTRYTGVGYTLMHNGYLEIAIRHGLFGLMVFLVMFVAFLRAVRRACAHGLISRPTLHCYYVANAFFCLTLLSNSNNRLAIGESFALVVGAIAFACIIGVDLKSRDLRQRKLPEQTPAIIA